MEYTPPLVSASISFSLQIRLLGFDGTGARGMRVPDSMLRQHLHSLKADMDTVVIEPALDLLVSATCEGRSLRLAQISAYRDLAPFVRMEPVIHLFFSVALGLNCCISLD
jgi:hypothetical protein